MPLTAAEVLAHPAYNTVEWHLVPSKKGKCDIAKNRAGGPFKLHYEIHGTGTVFLVWIMGLGAYRTAWKRQTKYFGHDRAERYSSLVFDNRGMGLSDKPLSRYSTSEMARDLLELLEHVGWISTSSASDEPATKKLHIIGVSMGGMIAQELCLLIPQYIRSLSLVSTAPRLVRTVPFLQNLRQRINMFVPQNIDVQLQEVAQRLFAADFLAMPDDELPEGNFPTRWDRFAAGELAKRLDKEGFTRRGFMLQAIAAGWHHKSAAQIALLGDQIGRERIAVLHGTGDKMITYHHAELLMKEFGPGIQVKTWPGKGHVLMWEEELAFNQYLEQFFDSCEQMPS